MKGGISGRSRHRSAGGLLLVLVLLALTGCNDRADARRLAELMQVKPCATVADFGAGKGALTATMAAIVGPAGHVYATEINPERLAILRKKVQQEHLDNVSVIEGGIKDTRLPADCCDAIFMRGVYHHLTDPAAIDASLYHALRPGGVIAVQDFRPSLLLKPWTPSGIPANRGGHGIRPDIVIDEMTAAGFKVEKVLEPWRPSWYISNYCVLFRKPAVPASQGLDRDGGRSAGS